MERESAANYIAVSGGQLHKLLLAAGKELIKPYSGQKHGINVKHIEKDAQGYIENIFAQFIEAFNNAC